MLTLTEPQVWVLIGVFATAIFGMMGIVTTSFTRTLTAAIGGLEARIGGLDGKLDLLDHDIQALSRRVFGPDPS